jgi:hypothetical protein
MVVTWKNLMAAIEQDPELKNKATEPAVQDEDNPKEKAEIERLFHFIGAYVVFFQDVEAKLDEIIQLAVGLDRWHVSHSVTALLSNSQKIDLVQSVVHRSEVADDSERQQKWVKAFDEVIQRLRTEAARRNRIVHSLYIFDFMKVGAPPLRSKRKRKVDAVSFDQEYVDASFISKATSDVAELSFDIGMVVVQLRHWSEQLGRQLSQACGTEAAGKR